MPNNKRNITSTKDHLTHLTERRKRTVHIIFDDDAKYNFHKAHFECIKSFLWLHRRVSLVKRFGPSGLLLLRESILPPVSAEFQHWTLSPGAGPTRPKSWTSASTALTFHLAQEVQRCMETADRPRVVQNILFLRKPNTQEQRLKSDFKSFSV